MIYTSNFAIAGKHENAVAISRGIPKWFKGRRYMPLAPSWLMVKIGNPNIFTPIYQAKVLFRLDPLQVAQELGQGSILLCWEKPEDFCHRMLVAEWLREAGIEVEEYEARKPHGR